MNKMNTKQKQQSAITSGARFVPVAEWRYTHAAIEAANKIPAGCVNEQSHAIGMKHAEPIIVSLDAAIQYANAHRARYESPLCEDRTLGDYWLDWVKSLRRLLDGDGAVALATGRSTDSKDNGACESMFWSAMNAAGFTEEDL